MAGRHRRTTGLAILTAAALFIGLLLILLGIGLAAAFTH